MKKLLVVLMIAVLLVSLCACNRVPSTRFLSSTQVNSLAKNFDDPQAEVSLVYTKDGKQMEVDLVYDLLLTQAPLATIRFITLVNEGFYDQTVLDTYNSTYNYLLFGRYKLKTSEIDGKEKYYKNPVDLTFKGEFKSNGYPQPEGGYAKFGMMSLAMYHADWTEDNNTFDDANGYLILSTSSETLNSDDYAVFAHLKSVNVNRGGEEAGPFKYPTSDVLTHIRETSRTTNTIYDDATEANSESIYTLSTKIKVYIRMLGDYDWSKLPTIG